MQIMTRKSFQKADNQKESQKIPKNPKNIPKKSQKIPKKSQKKSRKMSKFGANYDPKILSNRGYIPSKIECL